MIKQQSICFYVILKTRKHTDKDVTQMVEVVAGIDFTYSSLSSCINVSYISHSCYNVKINQ